MNMIISTSSVLSTVVHIILPGQTMSNEYDQINIISPDYSAHYLARTDHACPMNVIRSTSSVLSITHNLRGWIG
jgi:hypothetical protein